MSIRYGVEEVALVACARRELLLRAHAFRLRREDLEDCFSQATLELLAEARRGRKFASRPHVSNALEQRFVSRVHDRRRAVAGRSPMQAALETAAPLGEGVGGALELADPSADPERLAIVREELARLLAFAPQLTRDHRLALVAQIGLLDRDELCRHRGWSAERYRKVAQRARRRLKELMSTSADPTSQLAPARGSRVPRADRRRNGGQGPAHEDISPHS